MAGKHLGHRLSKQEPLQGAQKVGVCHTGCDMLYSHSMGKREHAGTHSPASPGALGSVPGPNGNAATVASCIPGIQNASLVS